MSKNSIVAFILMLACIAFFTSPQYNKFFYEKILKKPYPQQIDKNKQKLENNVVENKSSENVKKDAILKEDSTSKIDTAQIAAVKHDTIKVENEKIKLEIDNFGATIKSIKMKDYKYSNNHDDIDIMGDLDKNGATISIDGESIDEIPFTLVNENSKNIYVNKNEKKVLRFEGFKNNEKIIKEYEIGDDYKIGISISKDNLPGKRVKIEWKSGIVETEYHKDKNNSQLDGRKAHYYNGDNVNTLQMVKEGKEEPTGNFKWVGMSSKYFLITLVSDTLSDADLSINGIIKDDNSKKDKKAINYQISYEKTADKKIEKFWIYAGPSKYNEIKKYHEKFEKTLFPVIGFGKIFFWADKWFPPLAEFVLWVLLSLFNLVKDYGIAILILTLLSKVITYPLTHSSMKSMNKMKDVQPKIEAIRNKHKNNPKKLNEEIMALYKKEGVNPLNPGCLPMFLQMPVFIALFVVLKKAIELREATTVLIPWVKDLSKAEAIFTLPQPIPMYGDNIAIMPLIMAAFTFFQTKMTTKDPNQKAMIYIMPVFMLVLFNSFPSGLVIYWTFQSVLSLVQQVILDKTKKK